MINLKDPKQRKQFILEVCKYELKVLVAHSRLNTLRVGKVPKEYCDQCFADSIGWGINGNDVWANIFREAYQGKGGSD